MVLPKIIEKTIKPLKTVIGSINETALVNILNAKLMNMVTLKGVTFKKTSNSFKNVLSYYGINFMDSGSNKDYSITCINRYLLPFVRENITQEIEDYKEQIEIKMSLANKKEKKTYENILNNVRVPNFELENPNITGLYAEAQQINTINFGGIFIRISELGDYLDSITSGDKTKKELYSNLKNIYEGEIAPSIIAGAKDRETLYNIPVQCLLYTDFENLKNEKIKQYYLKSLKTGFARRCFIYMPSSKTEIKHIEKPYIIANAINELSELKKDYLFIFNNLPKNKVFQFTEEAQEKIFFDYPNKCIDYYNSSQENEIIKLEKKESYWKIAKLSVLYSILDDVFSDTVKSIHVDMAINFYESLGNSLKNVIENRESSCVEQLASYLLQQPGKIYSTTDLRKTNIINNKIFSKTFKELLPDLQDELEFRGYYITDYENGNKGNHKCYQLVKI